MCTELSATSIIQERVQKSKMFNCWTLLSLIFRADIVLINTPKKAQMHTGYGYPKGGRRFRNLITFCFSVPMPRLVASMFQALGQCGRLSLSRSLFICSLRWLFLIAEMLHFHRPTFTTPSEDKGEKGRKMGAAFYLLCVLSVSSKPSCAIQRYLCYVRRIFEVPLYRPPSLVAVAHYIPH